MPNNSFTHEDLEIIAAYLERLGVVGLRHPYRPDQINKRAVIRYLVAEKLQEAAAHPAEPDGKRRRAGQSAKQRKSPISSDQEAHGLRKRS